MCGLAGIFNLDGDSASFTLIKDMTRKIAHRGPDGEGFFVDENLALGHRRLAILDVSKKGAQPMHSHNEEWVVCFNGCIYNYQELRSELITQGASFISGTDTEVITEGLCIYGVDFFERFNGMFAIAAWHKPSRTLYLSRDRYGVKPLYYFFNGKIFLFASEIKSLIEHPAFKTELNAEALNEYFTFQNLFSYKTLFKGVIMLPPANTVKIHTGIQKVLHHSWWNFDFSEPDEQMSFEDARIETKRLFEQAVKRQMISDVPVGAFLSGGIDSGSITAVASSHVKRLTTFTAGFELSEVNGPEASFDERIHAELISNHFKTEHYEQVINAGDLDWSLPRVVWHMEDLKVGMSYPNFYIARLASKFVKVSLQGTGGDELYGGYPWRYYRIFQSLSQEEFFENYYGFWQRLVNDEQKSNFFQPEIFNSMRADEPRKVFERVFTFNPKLKYDTPEQHIQNSLYFEIKTFLPGLLLMGDKLAMASGLEERFPFLDNDLVNFAQKIPIRHKLRNLEEMKLINENNILDKKRYREYDDGKNVLRKAMAGFLPEKILNRKKQGFSAPDESWYRGENAAYVKKLLQHKQTLLSEFIQPEFVNRVIDEHMNQKVNHRLLLWSLMSFEWWCKLFLNGEKIDD